MAGRAPVLGSISYNTMIHLDRLPAPESQTIRNTVTSRELALPEMTVEMAEGEWRRHLGGHGRQNIGEVFAPGGWCSPR